MDRARAAGGAALFLAAAVTPARGDAPPSALRAAEPPALVVLLVADQFRADFLDRFGTQWQGGFARMRREGLVFTQARQDHAMAETAPGHSTLLSGRSPSSTGIISNTYGVADPAAPLVGAPDAPGASPKRFRGTTLADWMTHRWPESRLLSVSRKDRGAILPPGRARGDVFWYWRGKSTTSRWYADTLPAWLDAYNARGGPSRLANGVWTLLRPETDYPEPDDVPWEPARRGTTFPHRFPDSPVIEAVLGNYPWMDSLTLDLALEGVQQRQLGRRGVPDLLVVSLSSTDAVGHAYGPDSREMHDHLLRLDGWVGAFLDSLNVLVPRERTVIAFSADHGSPSFPESTGPDGKPRAGRAWVGDALRSLGMLQQRLRKDLDLGFETGLLTANVELMRKSKVNVDSVAAALADSLGRLPGMVRVWTPRTLATAPADDIAAVRWRRAIPPDQGWLLAADIAPGWIWSPQPGQVEHGAANDDDLRVPMVFLGAGIPPGRRDEPVRTEDIGVTLAALLGIEPGEPVEGRVLIGR